MVEIQDGVLIILRCDSRKGISQSALPYRRGVPTWLKQTPEDVKDQIYMLAKKGLMPSKIGKTIIILLLA